MTKCTDPVRMRRGSNTLLSQDGVQDNKKYIYSGVEERYLGRLIGNCDPWQ